MLRLTARILRGGGGAGIARLVLMVVGITIGVAAAGLVTGLPDVLDHREQVSGGRVPLVGEGQRAFDFAAVTDSWAGAPFNRIYVSDVTAGTPDPPGVDRLPGPGEYVASPALEQRLGTDSGLRALVPGRSAGAIDTPGLIGPDELYVYIGLSSGAIADASAGSGWGLTGSSDLAEQQRGLPQALALLVLPPAVLYLVVCGRLAAATRNRRYAALRLLGLRRRDVLRMAATESAISGLVGSGLGIAVSALMTPVLASSGLLGFTWFPDSASSWLAKAALAVLAVVAVSAAMGVAGLRRSLDQPLRARVEVVETTARAWHLIPLLLGVCVLVGTGITAASRTAAGPTSMSGLAAGVAAAGLAVALVGLLVGLRPLVAASARALDRDMAPVPLRLAARRLRLEPSSALRLLAGPVIMVVVAGVGSGLLLDLQARSAPPVQQRVVSVTGYQFTRPQQLAEVYSFPAQARWAQQANVNPDDIQSDDLHFASLVSVTCEDLVTLAEVAIPDCRPGELYLANTAEQSGSPGALRSGDRLRFRGSDETTTVVVVPDRNLLLPPGSQFKGTQDGTLVWTGTRPRFGWSPDVVVSLLLPGSEAALNDSRARISRLSPAARVEVSDDRLEMAELFKNLNGVLRLGILVGYVLGSLAFAIAAVDRALDRRRAVTSLRVLGMTPRELRTMQFVQLAVPTALSVLTAVLVGFLGGQVAYRLNDLSRPLSAEIIRAMLPLVAVSVAATLGATLAVVGLRLTAEDLHRE